MISLHRSDKFNNVELKRLGINIPLKDTETVVLFLFNKLQHQLDQELKQFNLSEVLFDSKIQENFLKVYSKYFYIKEINYSEETKFNDILNCKNKFFNSSYIKDYLEEIKLELQPLLIDTPKSENKLVLFFLKLFLEKLTKLELDSIYFYAKLTYLEKSIYPEFKNINDLVNLNEDKGISFANNMLNRELEIFSFKDLSNLSNSKIKCLIEGIYSSFLSLGKEDFKDNAPSIFFSSMNYNIEERILSSDFSKIRKTLKEFFPIELLSKIENNFLLNKSNYYLDLFGIKDSDIEILTRKEKFELINSKMIESKTSAHSSDSRFLTQEEIDALLDIADSNAAATFELEEAERITFREENGIEEVREPFVPYPDYDLDERIEQLVLSLEEEERNNS